MEKPKIAILTVCEKDFNRYKESQPKETHSQLVKISVLKDVERKEYSKAVLLSESKNVTDFVLKKVIGISLWVEDLSKNIIYK